MFHLTGVQDMHVYTYCFVDELQFIKAPSEVKALSHLEPVELEELISAVSDVLKSKGWSGEGKLGILWLPPFLFGGGSSAGSYVWHAKEFENGTSWMASFTELPFYELLDHNSQRISR